MRILSGIGTTLAILLLAGCNRSQTVVTPGGAAKVTETGKGKGTVEMEVGGQKVKAEYGTGKVPEDFPKDIPIYASYKHVVATNVGIARGVHLMSNDARAAISAFYEKALPAQGWKVEQVQRLGDNDEFKAKKGQRMLVVSILDKGSERGISITQLNL